MMPPQKPPEPHLGAGEPTSARSRPVQKKRRSPGCRSRPGRPTTSWSPCWLHGKSPNTIRAYGEDVAAFRAFTGKGLRATHLSDLQRYADALVGARRRRAPGACGPANRSSRSRPRWATWAELQALRTEETFGDDRVFPMSAVNAWKRVKRAARLAGITELPVSPHFLRHSHGTHALRRGDRSRYPRSRVDRDHQPLLACPAREV